jgi:hypothetical protein
VCTLFLYVSNQDVFITKFLIVSMTYNEIKLFTSVLTVWLVQNIKS